MGNNNYSSNSQLQSDVIVISYALQRLWVVTSRPMMHTSCVDTATDTKSCQWHVNQATFGSLAACTLPIVSDFE